MEFKFMMSEKFLMFCFFVGFCFYFGTQLVAAQMVEDQVGEVDTVRAMEVQRAGTWLIFLSGAVLAIMMMARYMGYMKDAGSEFGKRLRRK